MTNLSIFDRSTPGSALRPPINFSLAILTAAVLAACGGGGGGVSDGTSADASSADTSAAAASADTAAGTGDSKDASALTSTTTSWVKVAREQLVHAQRLPDRSLRRGLQLGPEDPPVGHAQLRDRDVRQRSRSGRGQGVRCPADIDLVVPGTPGRRVLARQHRAHHSLRLRLRLGPEDGFRRRHLHRRLFRLRPSALRVQELRGSGRPGAGTGTGACHQHDVDVPGQRVVVVQRRHDGQDGPVRRRDQVGPEVDDRCGRLHVCVLRF